MSKHKKLFFYLLVDPHREGTYKVGITTNPKSRIKSYRTSAPEAYFHRIYVIPDKKHEKKILYELSGAYQVHNEVIYAAKVEMLVNIIEGYLTDSGLILDTAPNEDVS